MATPSFAGREGATAISPVKSADRTIRILEAFAAARAPLPLSELARRVGMPVSACHGLVRTLTALGYLYETAPRRGHYPTLRWLEQARIVAAHDPLLERMSGVLEALARACGETVVFAKREGSRVMYLKVVESSQPIRYTASAGDSRPLHSSATGKAILMQLPAPERDALLTGARLARVTANTITSRVRLEAELGASARRGWAESRGENVPDVHSIAVPLAIGVEQYALALAGPPHRMEKAAQAHVARLMSAARTIGSR